MIIRLLLWLIVGFLVYTVYQAIRQALQKPSSPPPEKSGPGEDMVQDPHCGTYVPKSEAVPGSRGGQQHYFCSERCREAYTAKQS